MAFSTSGRRPSPTSLQLSSTESMTACVSAAIDPLRISAIIRINRLVRTVRLEPLAIHSVTSLSESLRSRSSMSLLSFTGACQRL